MKDDLLRGLRREITPARDLWPGIEGRLRARGSRGKGRGWTLGWAVAAAALLAFAIWRPSTLGSRPSTESVEVQATLIATTGPRSNSAKSLSRHITILDGAIGETESALRETPGDPALIEFLQTLQRRRFALLAQAARFAAES